LCRSAWPIALGILWVILGAAMPARAEDADSGVAASQTAPAPEDAAPEWFSLHGQFTNVTQFHPRYTSPYRGANSLDPGNRGDETIDATIYFGIRVWQGLEFYVNPEADQGFGLSDTLGVAGFPSGEAYKIGKSDPYYETQRAFARYTIGLGGAEERIAPDANQLGGTRQADNLTFTAGKFAVVDIFDTNTYAHDPRSDFMNWSVVESGAFDYAANAWGYTYGGAAEWTQSWWTLRGGVFDLSKVPNTVDLEPAFGQFEMVGEVEERHEFAGHPGKLKLLGFDNRGRFGNYSDAVRLAQQTGGTPNTALVRRFSSRPGVALNLEQEIASDLGAFARASLNDGNKEADDFADIDRSVTAGLSLGGNRWNRPDDTFGLAGVANGVSSAAREYFRAGGLGILIGDGQLPNYGLEKIVETYYSLHAIEHLTLGLDYQYIVNPAYNRDRGPVSVIGFRVHLEM
jgi:high affinity Mn2+ porin